MSDNTSTEVAERGPIDLARVPEKVRALLSRLDLSATMGTADAQLSIMEHIQEAETEEAIFAAADAGTVSGQSFTDRPFLLLSYEPKRSAPAYVQQGAFPFYLLMRVQDLATGREVLLDCGGFTVVSTIDALDSKGFIDKAVRDQGGYPMVLEGRQMRGSGFTVLIPHRYVPPAAKK